MIGTRSSNSLVKPLTIIVLVIGVISYSTQIVPLVFAYELSAPNKNLQVHWWDWILGIPAANSPVLDETGDFCDVDQRGPIWYLAGFAGSSEGPPFGGSADRDCNIPEGKAILIPIFNVACAEQTDAERILLELGLQTDDVIPPSQLKEGLIRCNDYYMSFVEPKQFSIDGQVLTEDEINDLRVVSPLFQIVYPDGNVFNQAPTNVKQKAVAEGYWVLVKGLEPGEHTIEIVSGLSDPFNFLTDVTYHLTIESKHPSSMLR